MLAAEEFGMPAPDERIPSDPTGIQEPHDVLAAEEFAMPAPDAAGERPSTMRDRRGWLPLVLGLLLLVALVRRRR